MSECPIRYPLLIKYYQQFLAHEDSAVFIKKVSESYLLGTLQRLYEGGDRLIRRAAILAIGYLGDFSLNEVMGNAMVDDDRAVRILAEHNIRQLWQRQGTPGQRSQLNRLIALNNSNYSEEVVSLASQFLEEDQQFGEFWNQRAIAYSSLGDYEKSISDCQQVLNCNRFHFPAAVGMGHCCLQLQDAFSALDCFRLAIGINPDLESLRYQIRKLEKLTEEG